MNYHDLDRAHGLVYRNPALGPAVRLWFRANTAEPVRVELDAEGRIRSERPCPCVATACQDGWEPAEPFPADDIVRAEDWQEPPEQPITAP